MEKIFSKKKELNRAVDANLFLIEASLLVRRLKLGRIHVRFLLFLFHFWQ